MFKARFALVAVLATALTAQAADLTKGTPDLKSAGPLAFGPSGLLFIGDKKVGENHMEKSVPLRFTTYAGMDIGKDNGEPVSPSYASKSPFAFTGKIDKVVFDLAPVEAPR